MQRALRESAQEAGIAMPEQESGIVDPSTSATYFGPANRNEYDPAQWAMVPSSTAVQTVREDDPPPSQRSRTPGAPAFLVEGSGSPATHHLGAFLTILHEIPLARNQLLQAGEVAASYGHNTFWWKGQQIIAPHVLAQTQAGSPEWEAAPEEKAFEEEIHRLMAFLDSTERSYGSAGVLTDLLPTTWHGIERQFYETFASRNQDQIRPFYTSVSLVPAAPNAQIAVDDEVDEEQEERFGVLETNNSKADFENTWTLYELLDQVMWGDMLSWAVEKPEAARMAVFRDMGEIFIINITGEGPSQSIEVPEEFYPERWLVSRKEEAWRMQLGWRHIKKISIDLEKAKSKLYEFRDPETGRTHNIQQLATQAKERLEGYSDYLQNRSRFRAMEESEFDLDKYPDWRAAPSQMTTEEEKLYQKIQQGAEFTQRLLEESETRARGRLSDG